MKYFFLFALVACQLRPAIPTKKVVLISIDGFRPEFYLNKEFNAPTLKKLSQKGIYSEGMVSVFPSVTYPNHTSIVTGKTSAQHGILSNTKFNWKDGPTTEWYWYEKDIKVKTLWDELKENGLKTAAIHWPVTAGAPIDYNIPEIFKAPPWNTEESFVLVNRHGTKNLANQLNKKLELKPYTNMKEADRWAAKVSKFMYEEYQPSLLALHIIYADKNQHESGRTSEQTRNAVTWIDKQITPLIESLDKQTCLLIVGDHGFIDYRKVIHINALFAEKGWIKLDQNGELKSYQVIAHKSGGQAAIYLKDQTIKDKVMRTLRLNQKLGYEIVSKKDLKRLDAFPEAIAALSAKDGFSLGQNYQGRTVEILDRIKGQHGHLPNQKKMHTGFLAYNCQLKPTETVISNLRIAPTIKKYLGLPLSREEISLQFQESKKPTKKPE